MSLHDPALVIAGVGLRLPPRTRTLGAHWDALAAGGVVRPPPPGRDVLGPDRLAAWLDDVEGIDLEALRLDEGSARWLDPAARLLLGCARDALATAGLDAAPGEVGLWVGLGDDGWGARTLHGGHAGSPAAGLGALSGLLATRIAYHLDLQGPAVAVDAACASALVAVAQAAGAVRAGLVELALAGGATALVGPTHDTWLRTIGALGPAPRPFSRKGEGYVRGEGAGLFLLAREDVARARGLPVLARLVGAGWSGGGRTNGLGAPTPAAHARAAAAALRGVERPVAHVELGGLGQPLADAVELQGVGRGYAGRVVAVGTSRSVYGHLEHASGVVALATALAALGRGRTPPVPPPDDPLPLPDGLRWTPPDAPLPPDALVAVHGGGMNGTVVHLVLAAGDPGAQPAPLPEERPVRPEPVAVTRAEVAAPADPLERLAWVVQDVFNLPEPPSPDVPLSWQGLDSLGLVALRQRLEEEYGVALSQEAVSDAGNLRELLAMLEAPPSATSWAVPAAAAAGFVIGVLATMAVSAAF